MDCEEFELVSSAIHYYVLTVSHHYDGDMSK